MERSIENVIDQTELTDEDLDTVTGGVVWFVAGAFGAMVAGAAVGTWISDKILRD